MTESLNHTLAINPNNISSITNITQLVEHPGIFLQSSFAKVISGTFAWIALFITCHQVKMKKFIEIY